MDGKKHVLVVEDDLALAKGLGAILDRLGYDVRYAHDAKRGSDLAQEADLIFLDLRLPGKSGETLLEELRDNGNYVPVVVMSAMVPRDEAVQRLKRHGIVDFIEKPFTFKEVAAKAGQASVMSDQLHGMSVNTNRLKGFIERQGR